MEPPDCGTAARRVKGNGNVTQLLDATNIGNITPAAHYECDPYGNLINSTGLYKDANPFRFSTKWFDEESGLYYYGCRYTRHDSADGSAAIRLRSAVDLTSMKALVMLRLYELTPMGTP